jgi:monoamine oxidase
MARSAIGRFVGRLKGSVEQRRMERGGLQRGAFLQGLAAAIVAAPAATGSWPRNRAGTSPRVVIVGCGAAGATCAYRLAQAGIGSTIYEANSRIGGRTWTLRGFFEDGQRAEHGGQLIASAHYAVRNLARELGLALTNLNALYPPGVVDTYFIAGQRYTAGEAIDDFDRLVYDPLRKAARAAGYPTTYERHTTAGVNLDHTNVDEWLDQNVPGGSGSKIATLLRVACVSEYGAQPRVQSALNLIYLLEGMPAGRLNLSGTGEDDRFHIAAGSDALVTRLTGRLPPGSVVIDTSLTALARNAGGSYACTFSSSGANRTVIADRVVLSIPFTVLRRVETQAAGFSPRKRMAIASLDLGSNAKVHLQFSTPYWYAKGYSGTVYADAVFQDSWDTSIGEPGKKGLLVCFPGGAQGATFGGPAHGPAPAATVREYLQSLEPALPGARAAFNGKAYQDFWAGDPFTHGAYSFYKVGQYTTLAGVESQREGNVHFCGEQTSYVWQGYINGAVASGERAASEILHDLGIG